MLINWQQRHLNLKVVYYGPALSGKTTNLEMIHSRVDANHRSDLISLKTNEDRTLYFDFVQLELGKICGLTPKINLYTVPGQSYYKESRKMVLRNTDGVVFVADSARNRLEDNLIAWRDMHEQLVAYQSPNQVLPVVVQYNKRDLPNAMSLRRMKKALGAGKYPGFEAVASEGSGILDTLKAIVQAVMLQVQNQI
ncbi:MAG TPA: ADP-ribosylation factor-like protein [Anaerolineaceae bacterium]|nr:ADP-ribosylation factor-like protein [Anaerolineaceae bacterium]